MFPNVDAASSAQYKGEFNLACGAGGSRAVLGSAGAILACHLAGINNWRTVGGASGGSVPTVMLAGGMHPREIVRVLVRLDFASLLTRKSGLARVVLAFFLKDLYEKTRPRKAIFGSEKAGAFIESLVATWPKNYWTVAAVNDGYWLFTAEGVFEHRPNGSCVQISSEAAPLGLAIRASCAVPGIIDAIEYKGHLLFDGALTIHGGCPVGIVKQHFKASPETIIACDVGEDESRRTLAICKALRVFSRPSSALPDSCNAPDKSFGVILIKPAVNHFRSLQFSINSDLKWLGVMCGFLGALEQLERASLLSSDSALREAVLIRQSFAEIRRSAKECGELSYRTEALLASHRLF